MPSRRAFARLILSGVLLPFGSGEVFPQAASIKKKFFAEFKDKLKSRGEYVEDVFRKKLTAAGFKFVDDAKRADVVLAIAVEQRTTLMMNDHQTHEVYKFKLTNPRGKRMWQSETIVKDCRTIEIVAAELLRVLRNSAKR